jgi:hypothetical protein
MSKKGCGAAVVIYLGPWLPIEFLLGISHSPQLFIHIVFLDMIMMYHC